LDKYNFDCTNVGANTVTLTATDASGNTASMTAVVTIKDVTPPTVMTKNITIPLNAAGSATIVGLDIDGGSADVCGIASWGVSQNTFTCANVGTNTVTLTVTDIHGNFSTGTATVTVQDVTPPTVVTKNIIVPLNIAGTVTIANNAVDGGSTDACGIASYVTSQTVFTCANVGTPVTVTLTLTDVNGNTASNTAVVTVVDQVPPTVVTQNITLTLDQTDNGSITAAQINNGSSDACGIANYSVTPNTFTLANLGANPVTLTVTDIHGNSATGTATVTVYPLPQGSLSANGPFCATGAGQLTWTATYGAGNYTIIYNDGTSNRTVTGITSGIPFAVFTSPVTSTTTYTLVSVQDAHGTRNTLFNGSSATITINPLPTLSAVPTQPLCNNQLGSVLLTPGAGTSPYTIAPTPAQTGLGAGSYTYTVSDINGCTATAIVTINAAPPLLVLSGVITQPVFYGQVASVALTVSGGTTPYSNISPIGLTAPTTVNNLTPGSYTYNVTDKYSCPASFIAVIVQSASPTWISPGVWMPNAPLTTDNAYIDYNLTVGPTGSFTALAVKNLTVISPFNLIVQAKGTVTATGILDNGFGSTTSSVQLLSDATTAPAGSLITGSIIGGGTYTAQRSMGSSGIQHYVSAPMSGQTNLNFTTPKCASPYYSFSTYNGTSFTNVPATPATTMLNMIGYAVQYSTPNAIVTFTGHPFYSGNQILPLPNTTYAASAMVLVGNPYPSAINWKLIASTTDPNSPVQTNITNTFYERDGGRNGSCNLTLCAGGITWDIPAMKGFLIKLGTSGAGSIFNLNNYTREHNTGAFWKNADAIPNLLRLVTTGGNYLGDETVVYFDDYASKGIDNDDADKLFEQEPYFAHLYTMSSDNHPLSINVTPAVKSMPLVFQAGVSGNYGIQPTVLKMENGNTVYLEDLQNGTLWDLSDGKYEFAYTNTSKPYNFTLYFGKPSSVQPEIKGNTTIYSNSNVVYVQNSVGSKATVIIYNALGREVKNVLITGNFNSIDMNVVPGTYMVKVVSENNVVVKKVFIDNK